MTTTDEQLSACMETIAMLNSVREQLLAEKEFDRQRIAELLQENDRLFKEANYFSDKLADVTRRHCDEIDGNFQLKCKLVIAGELIGSLNRELSQLRASASKQITKE
jgi:predicted metal-binding protein